MNIHLTGCHHSCAQHYIGDIGLLACRVQTSEDGDTVEGYHIHVGGGFGPDAALGREIFRDVKAEDAPRMVERMLKAYLAHRASPQETFLAFTRRHDDRRAPLPGRARGGRMSSSPRTPLPALVPETAPFSAEQRVWLNGLFAALLSLERGVTPLSPEQAAALLPGGFDLGAPAARARGRRRCAMARPRPCRSPSA